MLIRDPRDLTAKLRELLEKKVIVRYAMEGSGQTNFNVQLLSLHYNQGRPWLTHLSLTMSMLNLIWSEVHYSVKELSGENDELVNVATRWTHRQFDDWCHDQDFMGALEYTRDGQGYTSVKIGPQDERWHFLHGATIGQLDQLTLTQGDEVQKEGLMKMEKRFVAFVAQKMDDWRYRTLHG